MDLDGKYVRDLVLTLGLSEHGIGAPAAKRPSLSSDHPRTAEFFARLIRGHRAGGEIRNHWVPDAIFELDRTRTRNLNLNANLALLRGTLIALKARLGPHLPWPALPELCASNPALAYRLVPQNRFK